MQRALGKTRKMSLQEKNSKLYIYYAIGEIFLVVVGILVALQVNNWNEKRLKIEQKEEILIQILNDLDSDGKEIITLRESHKVKDDNSVYLMKYLLGETNERDEERLKIAFMQANNLIDFTPIKTSYDLLLESGAVNLITSRALKESLFDYYELDKFEMEVQTQKYDYTSTYGFRRFDHMPRGFLRESLYDRLNVGDEAEHVGVFGEFDWDEVKKDEAYITSLDRLMAISMVYFYDFNRYEAAQGVLVNQINEELGR